MKKIKLYTTNCPNCRILENELKKHDEYEVEKITNITEILRVADEHNILTAPFVYVDNKILTFEQAMKHIKQ